MQLNGYCLRSLEQYTGWGFKRTLCYSLVFPRADLTDEISWLRWSSSTLYIWDTYCWVVRNCQIGESNYFWFYIVFFYYFIWFELIKFLRLRFWNALSCFVYSNHNGHTSNKINKMKQSENDYMHSCCWAWVETIKSSWTFLYLSLPLPTLIKHYITFLLFLLHVFYLTKKRKTDKMTSVFP